MKKLLIVSAILLIVLVYLFYPETVITYPAGITAADQPKQTNLSGEKYGSWVNSTSKP
jgi:hypothetical protein